MELRDLKIWHAAALLALLLICSELRLWPLKFAYDHPDEIIAMEVARNVVTQRSADTNWKNADLPAHFKVPQYNFSGYLLSAAAVTALAGAADADPSTRLVLLRRYSAWLGVLVVGLTFALGWRMFGPDIGVVAAALALVHPLFVQDSLYARPENFLTALTVVLLILLGGTLPRLGAAAVVAGMMVGTKISSAAFLPLLLLPGAEIGPTANWGQAVRLYMMALVREAPRRAVVAALGAAAGFLIAAPFALVNFRDFVTGVQQLVSQYTTGHWPYGVGEGPVIERGLYALRYFVATDGWPLLIAAVVGVLFAIRERHVRSLAIAGLCAVLALRFATYPTFFERNFSNLIPVLLVFAAFGAERFARAVGGVGAFRMPAAAAVWVIVAVSGAFTSYAMLAKEVNGRSKQVLARLRENAASAYGLAVTPYGWDPYYQGLTRMASDLCRPMLVEIPYVEEKHSLVRLRETISNYDLKEVARYRSNFERAPYSTLAAYFTPTTLFLYRNAVPGECAKRESFVAPSLAGAVVDAASLNADPAWTKSGDYPAPASAADPADYFASWSGADSNTGSLRMAVNAESRPTLLLPYKTGPVPLRQSIRIVDASGAVIWSMNPLPVSEQWTYVRIALPPQTQFVSVEAVDAGAGWGEWHAVAPPHTFLSSIPSGETRER
jgi:hypothetical protein